MSRSRLALVAAWGLLAVGAVVSQLDAGPAGVADGHGAGPSRDRLAGSTSPPADGRDRAAARPAIDEPPPVDPPIHPKPTPRPAEAVIATAVGDGVVSLRDPAPGDPVYWFANPTEFGGDRTFLVIDDTSSPDYVKVSLPVMPNGQEGWLARSDIELSTVSHRAEVDLSEATVTVWDGRRVVATSGAVIGRPSAPTPVGTFYIRDIIPQPDPSGDYGPWILALSGFSETLESFDGGLPALALHGTDEPEEIGSAISSGCVRLPNEVIELLAGTIPLGTPVTIVA